MTSTNTPTPPNNKSSKMPSLPNPKDVITGSHQKVKHHFSDRTRAIITIIVLLIIGGGTFYGVRTSNSNQPADSEYEMPEEIPPPSVIYNLEEPDLKTNNVFLEKPQAIKSFHAFKNEKECSEGAKGKKDCYSLYGYVKLGTTSDGQEIDAIIGNTISAYTYIVLRNSDGTGGVLGQHSPELYGWLKSSELEEKRYLDDFAKGLNDGFELDAKTKLAEINFPDQYSDDGNLWKMDTEFLPTPATRGMPNYQTSSKKAKLPSNRTKLFSKDGKDFYRTVSSDEPTYQIIQFFSTIKLNYIQQFDIVNPFKDDTKVKATWNNGVASKEKYTTRSSGCGFYGSYETPKGLSTSQLSVAGIANSGETLYNLPLGSGLMNLIYEEYQDRAKNYLDKKDAYLKNLTPQQFQDMHLVFLVENSLGDLVLYKNNKLFGQGGCAKPVIYLYPQKTTNVSVRVGAHITESVPSYGDRGWSKVVAHPSGKLSVNGREYDSLFWEGTGEGAYPKTTHGTVVRKSKVISTIKNQLAAQGFNRKEAADFLDFWQSRLPKTPYTRLTWLDTRQLNTLAPLHISPKPDTVLRTFLDFQGLNEPTKLTPQAFYAPERRGFTVTEWGGLR